MTKNICVYSSSSSSLSNEFFHSAQELGEIIGEKNYNLIYGGGNIGLMGILAQSVHRSGGRVIGVIPEFLKDKELAYTAADELIVTKDMRERKQEMEERADAFISMPGGFGTLEEIFEILTLKQLKITDKPIIFINTNGFYDRLMHMFEHLYNENFVKEDCRKLYFVASNAREAISYIESYEV
jgi:uncharacterized protein (TIGR00730 family)